MRHYVRLSVNGVNFMKLTINENYVDRLKEHCKIFKLKLEESKVYANEDDGFAMEMSTVTIARNDLCPCGSGKKYKKCCGKNIDEPGPLEEEDILKVTGIDGVFDLYGIVVKARKGRKQSMFPLCLLELVEKDSKNYQLVNDYNLWFSNL